MGRPSMGLEPLGSNRADHVARYRRQQWRWLGAGLAAFVLGFLAMGVIVLITGPVDPLPWLVLGAMGWGVACAVRSLVLLSRVRGLDRHSLCERFHGPGPETQPSAKVQRALRSIGVRPGSVVSLFVLPGSDLLLYVDERPVPVKRMSRVALTSALAPLEDHAYGGERNLNPIEEAELRALWVRGSRPRLRDIVGFSGLATLVLGFPAVLTIGAPLRLYLLAFFGCWGLSGLLLYGTTSFVLARRARRRPMSGTLLTRNGSTLLLGQGKLVWQEGAVPGPARLARGGLRNAYLEPDVRALVEVRPVTF
ncbi:MAG: hypothetical protein KC593_05430 [Myxococcales bacterium]|nr:hypothetical protein [Myxococcales bacterium]